MIGIVIVTHGKMALELANSVKMVFGSLDHVHPVCFTADMELDDLQEEVRKVAEEYADQPLIFMTDMFGGSAFNVSSTVMKKGIDILVAGVNMPLLLDVLFSRDEHDVKTIHKEIINDMAKYIVIYEGGT